MNQDLLKNRIMKRVYRVHKMQIFADKVYSFFTLRLVTEIAVAGLSLIGIFSLVSVPHVISNAFRDGNLNSAIRYLFDSLVHTKFIVQIVFAFGLVSAVLFIVDAVSYSFKYQRLSTSD